MYRVIIVILKLQINFVRWFCSSEYHRDHLKSSHPTYYRTSNSAVFLELKSQVCSEVAAF